MENNFESEVKIAYEAFDQEYEANEVQPYNAAFDYYYAGAKLYKDKYDELYDNYIRLHADIDNMRKHFQKKEADMNTYKYETLFKGIMEVFDDAIRAGKAGDLSEGAIKIMQKLNALTSSNGLSEYMPNKGDKFNEETMEAVALYPAGEEFSHKVVDCSISGYVYNGKIIRYPKVIVGQ